MSNIHPTAVIDASVKIGKNVKIGPYCVITGDVTLADEVELKAHVYVTNHTYIGEGTVIHPFASVGNDPQDLKYEGEASSLVVGENCIIREHATLNIGTKAGGMKTVVGDNCLIMTAAHVAHDCIIGNHVRLSNNVTLAGHVVIEDYANLGGMSAVHQFVRIGQHAMIGGMSGVEHDVLPYGLVVGERASLVGLNLVGLKRRGFSNDEIHSLKDAYQQIFFPQQQKNFSELVTEVASKYHDHTIIQNMIHFIQSDKSRGICRPKVINGAS